MNEDIQVILDTAKEGMSHSIEHLEKALSTIRAGRATPSMLSGVRVDYYGTETPLTQIANINTPDPRTISVQPWEKGMLGDIAQAITYANLGLNPQDNGEMIIISVPPLTEERRKDLVKKSQAEGENAKVSIRSVRKDAMDEIKALEKDGLSEDMAKTAQAKVQDIVTTYTTKIDEIISKKETDIMTV